MLYIYSKHARPLMPPGCFCCALVHPPFFPFFVVVTNQYAVVAYYSKTCLGAFSFLVRWRTYLPLVVLPGIIFCFLLSHHPPGVHGTLLFPFWSVFSFFPLSQDVFALLCIYVSLCRDVFGDRACIYLSGTKNRPGHWVYFPSTC